MDDTPSGLVLFAISFGLLLMFVLFLWAINVLPGKMRALMSREAAQPVRESVPTPVHVPVPSTSTAATIAEPVPPAREPAAPDTNAPEGGTNDWQMPRISRRLTDDDMIALLALQRLPTGKHRYSANQIFGLVGGSRAKVLARVSEVREGPPEYKPLSPEQLAARQALGLDKSEVANGSN